MFTVHFECERAKDGVPWTRTQSCSMAN